MLIKVSWLATKDRLCLWGRLTQQPETLLHLTLCIHKLYTFDVIPPNIWKGTCFFYFFMYHHYGKGPIKWFVQFNWRKKKHNSRVIPPYFSLSESHDETVSVPVTTMELLYLCCYILGLTSYASDTFIRIWSNRVDSSRYPWYCSSVS